MEKRIKATIGNENSAHLYEIDAQGVGIIEVNANTAAQSRRIAEKAGYIVRSVNMVG